MDDTMLITQGMPPGVHGKSPNYDIQRMCEALRIPGLAARVLCARGIIDPDRAQEFLHPKLENLSDPFLLPDVEQGVARTIAAVKGHEKICLYGDYDADGVTSVAILSNFLKHVGICPEIYIPERTEGYGLNISALKKFREQGISLLVCLDCGSSNVEEVAEARQYGIDVVIIDHHEPPVRLPHAVAFINPKRRDSFFPTRELAACGVTFFFVLALRRIMSRQGLLKQPVNLKKELDLVAVGSMGDMVPLLNDNRILVKFGLETMRKKPRTWLKTFFSERILHRGMVDEYTLNFMIIPRINAAGRVSDARQALAFLTSEDHQGSRALLAELNEINKRRQRIEEVIIREITESLSRENLDTRKSIVLYNEDWHLGVIGIVAQKLVERFGKPSIILTRVGDYLKGSGRGGNGIDLYATVASLSPLLLKYGGHRYACGVALAKKNLTLFAAAFEESLREPMLPRETGYQAEAMAEFEELTSDFMGFMEDLSPFGTGNPRPNLLFTPSSISLNDRFVKVKDSSNRTWYGSIHGQSPLPQNGPVHIVASPALREQRGEAFIHLTIKDILPVVNPV